MKSINSKGWAFIFTIIFCHSASFLFSQNVQIGYDAAGNRVFLYSETERTMGSSGQSITIKKPPFLDKLENDVEELFSISPNPSKDIVTLSSKIKSEEGVKYSLTLYDAMGKSVGQFPKAEIPFTLDLSVYPIGLYFLKVSNKEMLQTLKIMKK